MDNSPLQKLSAELRNEIYALALAEEKPVDIFKEAQYVQPPLTRVCKQARSESLLIFYSTNTFTFSLTDEDEPVYIPLNSYLRVEMARAWIQSTQSDCHQLVPKLTIVARYSIRFSARVDTEEMLEELVKLLKEHGYEAKRLRLRLEDTDLLRRPRGRGPEYSRKKVKEMLGGMGFGRVEIKS